MRAILIRQADDPHALDDIRFAEAWRRTVRVSASQRIADEQRAMRPGGLRQVLDRRADAAGALDQVDITGSQGVFQLRAVGRRRRAADVRVSAQPACQPTAQPARCPVHRLQLLEASAATLLSMMSA